MTAGRLTSGGTILTVHGAAGPLRRVPGWKGGTLTIEGHAGERSGPPVERRDDRHERRRLARARRRSGVRAGDRLRRGFILIEGRAGAYAGSRMIAGTLAIGGEAGDLPGYLMGRGTILLGEARRFSRRPSAIAANMTWSRRGFWPTTSPKPAPRWGTGSVGRCAASPAISPRSAKARVSAPARLKERKCGGLRLAHASAILG